MPITSDLGKLAMSYEGTWDAERSYSPLSEVTYQNSRWITKLGVDAGGDAPDVNPAWVMSLQGYLLSSAVDSAATDTAATSLALKTVNDTATAATARLDAVGKSWFLSPTVASFEDDTFIWNSSAKTLTAKQEINLFLYPQGAGGGGGGGSTPSGTVFGAAGGAAGECAIVPVRLAKGAVVPVTFGLGGAGGQGGPDNAATLGKSGGTTSFGAYASAVGGVGGAGVINTGANLAMNSDGGGRASNVRPSVPTASNPAMFMMTTGLIRSGHGGSSMFGVGGGSRQTSETMPAHGKDGNGNGSGGSGGAAYGVAVYGGKGTDGCIYLARM